MGGGLSDFIRAILAASSSFFLSIPLSLRVSLLLRLSREVDLDLNRPLDLDLEELLDDLLLKPYLADGGSLILLGFPSLDLDLLLELLEEFLCLSSLELDLDFLDGRLAGDRNLFLTGDLEGDLFDLIGDGDLRFLTGDFDFDLFAFTGDAAEDDRLRLTGDLDLDL